MTSGRLPKPVEQKRLLGNPGGRPLPKPLALMPATAGQWQMPDGLGEAGRALWSDACAEGVIWLAKTDKRALVEACHAVDAAQKAWERYMFTTDPKDMTAYTAASKEARSHLSELGFTPASRSRLGVAEVKAQGALQDIIARRSRGN